MQIQIHLQEQAAVEPERPGPRLWLPFAGLGLGLGWLAAALVHSSFVGLAPWRYGALTALLAALGCGLVGWRVQRAAARPLAPLALPLIASLVVAGIAVGLAVGASGSYLQALGSYVQGAHAAVIIESALAGAAVGAVCGLLFAVPCGLVIRAARRPTAIRSPSLLSGCQRRYVWHVVALCLAVASLVELPDQLARTGHLTAVPQISGWLLGALAVLVGGLGAADLIALLRVLRARRLLDRAEAITADASPSLVAGGRRLDLGLGDGLRAIMRRASPYRDAERVDTLVIGDVDAAVGAVLRAFRRSAACAVGFAALYSVHAAVALPGVTFAVLEDWCLNDSLRGCYHASQMIEQGDVSVAGHRHRRLLERSCQLGLINEQCRAADLSSYSF